LSTMSAVSELKRTCQVFYTLPSLVLSISAMAKQTLPTARAALNCLRWLVSPILSCCAPNVTMLLRIGLGRPIWIESIAGHVATGGALLGSLKQNQVYDNNIRAPDEPRAYF
jgi:hypothetical protein